MPRLADRQRDFSEALLNPSLPAPPGLVGPDDQPSQKRFSVYRNNVVTGLIEALKAAYPAVCRLVGLEFFREMSRLYVYLEPPRSPILLDYGAGFPDFIAEFEPASSLPYLADVARIERAWTQAYHAPEATAVEADDFATIATNVLPHVRLQLHPSVRIVRSRLPALTIWRMNIEDGVPGPVDLAAGGEDALVLRPDAQVEVWSMPPGGADFVAALIAGRSVAQATKVALTSDARFDLAPNLTELIVSGAFVAARFGEGAGFEILEGQE